MRPRQTASQPTVKPPNSFVSSQAKLQLSHLQHCLELCILKLANVVIVVQVIYKAQQAALLVLLDSLSLQACTMSSCLIAKQAASGFLSSMSLGQGRPATSIVR